MVGAVQAFSRAFRNEVEKGSDGPMFGRVEALGH
jgi:hypothetical protein